MLHMADTNSKSTIKAVEKSQACYRPLIQQNIGFISDVFFTVFRNFWYLSLSLFLHGCFKCHFTTEWVLWCLANQYRIRATDFFFLIFWFKIICNKFLDSLPDFLASFILVQVNRKRSVFKLKIFHIISKHWASMPF